MHSSSLDRASAVEFALGSEVCGMGKFGRGKYAEVMFCPCGINLCLPFRSSTADAKKTRKIARGCGSVVLGVFDTRNKAQVLYSVVAPSSVYVVYLLPRQTPLSMYPSKAMGQVQSAKNLNLNISVGVGCSGSISDADALVRSTPSKDASFRVVVKQLAQTLCGKIGLSHDVPPVRIGQRPARVDSTGGLRHFITHACFGAMGITKCLHKSARSAADVCMPANYRRTFNHLGAFNPLNDF